MILNGYDEHGDRVSGMRVNGTPVEKWERDLEPANFPLIPVLATLAGIAALIFR